LLASASRAGDIDRQLLAPALQARSAAIAAFAGSVMLTAEPAEGRG